MCYNINDVHRLVAKYGFAVEYLEEMEVVLQLALFAQAKVIIGLHGAGLTNIVACQPGSILVELAGNRRTLTYEKTAKAIGINYISIQSPQPESTDLNWKVDIDRLNDVLSNLLGNQPKLR